MINKSSHKFVTCLQVSIFVLTTSLISKPLKAQTIKTELTPNYGSFFLSQSLSRPRDIPQPSNPQFPPTQLPPQLPPSIELLPPSNSTTTPEQQFPNNVTGTIVVERFEVVGSTVFSSEKLTEVTKEFTKKPISIAELYQARSKITELYVQNGYITSGAYIPLQTIKSGVVRIQVVEGKLQEIQVIGTRRLNPDYIRSRLQLGTSAPLNQKRLLEALQLLQLNPLIKNVVAELSSGVRPGSNILQVKVIEAKSFNTRLELDNGRLPSVGTMRRRLNLSEANLLGLGDNFNFEYTNTDGSNTFQFNYAVPVNPRNGTISFNYGTSASNIIENPFNVLDIRSYYREYEVTYRQPIFQTPREEFALGFTASHRESEAYYIQGAQIPFPALGADDQGRNRVTVLRFFQEWTNRDSQQVMALRSQFNLGIGALDATYHQQPPDGRFFLWRGQAQWVKLLAPDTLLLLRANTQLASRTLLPLEQFGLGGLDNVRGYRQDYLLSDNGAFASAEVQVPILRLSKSAGILQVIPFADFGVGWNTNKDDPNDNTLASVGIGLRWTQGNNFTARLDWGIPLISVSSHPQTWQENGLYFSLQYNPF